MRIIISSALGDDVIREAHDDDRNKQVYDPFNPVFIIYLRR